MFCLSDGQLPGVLDRDPVDGVLAPLGPVFRLPFFRSACALGTVGAGGDRDEMLRVVQVVCVLFPLLR